MKMKRERRAASGRSAGESVLTVLWRNERCYSPGMAKHGEIVAARNSGRDAIIITRRAAMRRAASAVARIAAARQKRQQLAKTYQHRRRNGSRD